ncbi:uncharacterized protein CEXT_781041 [Caerostris extrusa]|uniref:Uncharacterized protein n=1 Tax=Caerostris extrusa TaxID=172846 RepID=A0AAV4TLY3_CAEEX|nr:uncharacterized protein CEXT_781041 [Caerostris extrusa]
MRHFELSASNKIRRLWSSNNSRNFFRQSDSRYIDRCIFVCTHIGHSCKVGRSIETQPETLEIVGQLHTGIPIPYVPFKQFARTVYVLPEIGLIWFACTAYGHRYFLLSFSAELFFEIFVLLYAVLVNLMEIMDGIDDENTFLLDNELHSDTDISSNYLDYSSDDSCSELSSDEGFSSARIFTEVDVKIHLFRVLDLNFLMEALKYFIQDTIAIFIARIRKHVKRFINAGHPLEDMYPAFQSIRTLPPGPLSVDVYVVELIAENRITTTTTICLFDFDAISPVSETNDVSSITSETNEELQNNAPIELLQNESRQELHCCGTKCPSCDALRDGHGTLLFL